MATAAVLAALLAPGAPAQAEGADHGRLRLVVLDGPGTAGYAGPLPAAERRDRMLRRQDAALASVDSPEPVYRWTTALNGFAVRLTDPQATRLQQQPGVSGVEANQVRRLSSTSASRPYRQQPRPGPGHSGAGTVIGIVDTGIAPGSALFAAAPGVADRSGRFVQGCRPGEQWPRETCTDKLVAADWFVSGFGEDRLGSQAILSARDVLGHGTEVASIAAGNSGVAVDAGTRRGRYRGVAPDASVAAYKACWGAPDPHDDGCATADLVAAVDRATRDRVDVLNLSVQGAPGHDAVDRALLGAAEAGIVVVTAAGNAGQDAWTSHGSPWVTTVGGLTATQHAGSVRLGAHRRLTGVMTADRTVRGRAVLGRDVPAPGSSRALAATCAPGSLDAARVNGRVVVCERGAIGRVEKSAAVARADGVGMVLVNVRPGPLAHDLHAVPTVHLSETAGQQLVSWLGRHPRRQVTLAPTGGGGTSRVASWSSGGDPTATVLKPDLVAPGTGVLAGIPTDQHSGDRWAFASGTSAATAWTSGAAAVVRARHPQWSAAAVRSSLVTSAARVGGASPLRQGAGTPRIAAALRAPLAYDVSPGDYRAWLRGRRAQVNTPSLLVRAEDRVVRRLTNLTGRTGTWTVSLSGFERYDVQVSPTTLTLRPGRPAAYRVSIGSGSAAGGLDSGWITWRGPGGPVSIPVAITR